jgi:3-methyl-2-oxobutanoate hydroxymethyltransferase
MSYQACEKEAIHNAGLLMQNGADCVKMEGNRYQAPRIEAVVKAGIPVMGHIGLTPQTAAALGGFKLQGKGDESANLVMEDALAFEKAGAFSILMECLPESLGTAIHNQLTVPTVSVGAGPATTGFDLNAYDLLGMFDAFTPKFVKRYRETGQDLVKAFNEWNKDVKDKVYPAPEHCFKG